MTQTIQTHLITTEIEQAFDDLLKIQFSDYSVHLYFGAQLSDAGLYSYADVPLDATLGNELRTLMQTNLRPKRRSRTRKEISIQPYDPEAGPDADEIEYEPTAGAPDVMEYIEPLTASFAAFDATDQQFVRRLRTYAIVFTQPDAPTIYCFRHYTAKKILRPGHGLLAFMNRGVYGTLDTPAIQIDEIIDCICWNGHIFIFDRAEYDKIFREGPHVKEAALEALNVLEAQTIIDQTQFAQFHAACMRDPRKRARLRNIALKGRLDAHHLKDFATLQRTIDDYKIDVQIVEIDHTRRLHYGRKAQWDFLRLLGDDFVQSPLTGNRYVTQGKRQRG
jgi:hypothetical protein